MLAAVGLLSILLLGRASIAVANPRCPVAQLRTTGPGQTFPTVPEDLRAAIADLWLGVGGPDAPAADGPLGCPLGLVALRSEGTSRTYGAQEFQHGWVFVEFGKADERVEAILIRSVGQWWAWWKGGPRHVAASEERPPGTPPSPKTAIWGGRGAKIAVAEPARTIALWGCQETQCSGNDWHRLTPAVEARGLPFDFASQLDLRALTVPAAVPAVDRVAAALPRWLPCFSALPRYRSDANMKLGEDDTARLLILLRRRERCPVSGDEPVAQANQWLQGLVLPEDQLPGTDGCGRLGDLDVPLAGLLHAIYTYRASLYPQTLAHLTRDVLAPWGGAVRSDAYVQPEGECWGVQVIESENHLLLQETDRYLINALLSESSPDEKWRQGKATTRDWLLRFLHLFPRRDFFEYNSIPYERYQLKALWLLYDYSRDEALGRTAEGILDLLFAKYATASDMLRDLRPYRRLPNADIFNAYEWFGGSSSSRIAIQVALLKGGGLHYLHNDVDLTDPANAGVFTDVTGYAALGSLSDFFGAEITDVANTLYRPPKQIGSWYEERFEPSQDLTTYLQLIHHKEETAAGSELFLQSNDGVEIYSGNRNWTMSAGGVDVALSDPGTPPGAALEGAVAGAAAAAAFGAAIGAFSGGISALLGATVGGAVGALIGLFAGPAIANSKKDKALQDTQAAVMRETVLIPTSIGLDRGQTIRFGFPHVAEPGREIDGRTCVAEGFMCGLDLRMPRNPFPANDCPLPATVPPELDLIVDQHAEEFGCLVEAPTTDREWSIWTFDGGKVVWNERDPLGSNRWAYAYVHDQPGHRSLRVHWKVPGHTHDWFNLRAYTAGTHRQGGEADDNFMEALAGAGDPDRRDTQDWGDVVFDLNSTNSTDWELLLEGCDPTYFLFVRTGHECDTNILPVISINIAPRPKQPFACKAHFDDHTRAFILEVGSPCSTSPYGLFLYVWSHGCTYNDECPNAARSFGFVIAAPSSGFGGVTGQPAYRRFAAPIDKWFHDFATSNPPGYSTLSWAPMTILVPLDKNRSHTIAFRWRLPSHRSWAITNDSQWPARMASVPNDIDKWPLAESIVTANGHPSSRLIRASNDKGCFTVTAAPPPSGNETLVVDLRNEKVPEFHNVPANDEPLYCR